jgi:hypothetical protein
MRLQCVILAAVCLGVTVQPRAQAQSKATAVEKSSFCTRVNALDLIKQQVDLTKTYDDRVRRLTLLLRAADVTWPYQQDRARAAFAEAFELATQEHTKFLSSKPPRSLVLRLQKADQRYVVIRAVAKRDAAWAKELVRQMLEADEAERSRKDLFEDTLTAEQLLDSAIQLLATDYNTAIDLARVSLKYPASATLTRFLYSLAAINQPAADDFYVQALTVYSDKPLREFLYLQAYPFAGSESGNTPVYAYYSVPAQFKTNQVLQRRFIQTLLRRAQQAVEAPLDESDTYHAAEPNLDPAAFRLLNALIEAEPQVKQSLPDLASSLTQAREKLLVSLPLEYQKLLLQPGREVTAITRPTFAERVEAAEKSENANERDGLIADAVLGGSASAESADVVIQAVEKISDESLRKLLIEWFRFQRGVTAIRQKDFVEAEKLATKIDSPASRAYLYIEIAKAFLKKPDAQAHARELLEDAVRQAKKVGPSIFMARILLTASSLYATSDLSRSISLLAEAITCINQIETPDFTGDDQATEIQLPRKGKSGQYMGDYIFRFYMPGFDPERTFRTLAPIDFDTAIAQSNTIADKFQRGLSIVAIADVCLQQTQQPAKKKPDKPKA